MDDPHVVAVCHDANDHTDQRRRVMLGVAALLDDRVEQLSAVADIHGEAHVALVLVDPADAHDVGMSRKVVHDLHLAAHVIDLLGAAELALGDYL